MVQVTDLLQWGMNYSKVGYGGSPLLHPKGHRAVSFIPSPKFFSIPSLCF